MFARYLEVFVLKTIFRGNGGRFSRDSFPTPALT